MTDVEREILSALGYLLVQANYLDDALVDLYWLVAGKTEVDLILAVRGKTSGSLCQVVVEAFEARVADPGLRAQFDSLKPKLDEAIRVRNEFIHASYVFAQTSLKHRRLPKTGPAVEKNRTLSVGDVEAAIDVLGEAQEETYAMYDVTQRYIPRHEVHPRGGFITDDGTYVPSCTWSM